MKLPLHINGLLLQSQIITSERFSRLTAYK